VPGFEQRTVKAKQPQGCSYIAEELFMLSSLTRNWWAPVLSGVVAILAGIAAFVWPSITFEVLVLLFGAYAFIDGVLWFSLGVLAAGEHERWWPLVVGGIVGIVVGVLAFAQTQATALALVYVIGVWAIVTGLLEIVVAVRLREIISTEWLMGFGGLLSIIFGVLVLAQPNAGAYALVVLFGAYAILIGISQVAFGFRMRGLGQDVQGVMQPAPSSVSN